MRQRTPRQKSEKHLDFIRALPCVVCLNPIETEAAHVRFSCAMAGTYNSGVGAKPHDHFTVPLCGTHHRQQHGGSERGFWEAIGINPHYLALALYSISGDFDAGTMVVVAHNQRARVRLRAS